MMDQHALKSERHSTGTRINLRRSSLGDFNVYKAGHVTVEREEEYERRRP